MPKLKELKFEDALKRLETIVQQLEVQTTDLDSSLALFEEGIAMARLCQSQLADAKKKIDVFVKETGELKPFESDTLQ